MNTRPLLFAAGISFVALATISLSPAICRADSSTPVTITQPSAQNSIVTVDCIGDSITAGVGSSVKANNYPSLLGDLLGASYNVENFGESGATLLKNGNSPYWQRGSFAKSADAAPNVVVIMLGTNDSKPVNWVLKDQFASDYSALIDYYAQMPTHPQIFVCTPPPVPGNGNYGINEPNVEAEIPIIEQVATLKNDPVIDVHSALPNDPSYFRDNVHPNDNGYVLLASTIYAGLTHAPAILPIASRSFTGSTTVTITPSKPGNTIRFTTDGTDPSRKSPIYGGPITVTALETIKAQEFNGRKPTGLISTATYTPTAVIPSPMPSPTQ